MKKKWTVWALFVAAFIFGLGLVPYGCGKQEVREQAAPAAPVAEAPSASAPEQTEQGTTAATPAEEQTQPAAAKEATKSAEM